MYKGTAQRPPNIPKFVTSLTSPLNEQIVSVQGVWKLVGCRWKHGIKNWINVEDFHCRCLSGFELAFSLLQKNEIFHFLLWWKLKNSQPFGIFFFRIVFSSVNGPTAGPAWIGTHGGRSILHFHCLIMTSSLFRLARSEGLDGDF